MAAERELQRVGRRLPPDSYHRVRYENLLIEPDHVSGQLCDFLGGPMDASMLDRAAAASGRVLRRGGHELHVDRRSPSLELARLGARATNRQTQLTRRRAQDAVQRRRYPVPLADEGS